ncbi:hypothetical protein K430107D3_09060 [Dysosmobacter welbionis]
MGLLNPGGPIAQFKRNRCSISPVELILQSGVRTLEFFTAWSSVPTILEALSRKYPDQTISYCWADEDIGSNVGEAVYKNGEMIDANIPEPGSREAYELASDIMGIDLADFDLYLSADKSTYEYHEDPSKTKRTKDGPAR